MERVLSIDLGASSLRAALVDRRGRLTDAAARAHDTGDEADPAAWWGALSALADPAWAAAEAVCITGFTRTQVLLNAAGHAVRPAITFRDARACGFGVDPFHPLARLRWLARHEPASVAAAAGVVDPKDALAAGLTGRVCTDAVSGARLAGETCTETLPPLAIVGVVRPGTLPALEGRPVVMAAHDSWASVLGLGAMRPGGGYALSGTTDVLGLLSSARAEAPGLLTDAWSAAPLDALWHVGGPSNAGGDGLAWLMGLLAPGDPVGPALERALRQPRRAGRAVFVPYLNGERTPFWDAGLRGGFAGLLRDHGPADLAWAVIEGAACHARLVLDRAEAACGPAVELRIGGGAAGPAWRQVRADVFARPVQATAEPECGLLGAGIAAWTALGAFPDLIAAQDAMVRLGPRHEPGRDTTQLRAAFDAAAAALARL